MQTQPTVVSCTLVNPSAQAVQVMLVGPKGKMLSELEGRILTDGVFLSDDSSTPINVYNANGSLKRVSEFLNTLGGHIAHIKLRSDQNVMQAQGTFFERTFAPIPPDQTTAIAAAMTIGQGEDAYKTIHTFANAFEVAPNKALLMTVQPYCQVNIEMLVNYHAV